MKSRPRSPETITIAAGVFNAIGQMKGFRPLIQRGPYFASHPSARRPRYITDLALRAREARRAFGLTRWRRRRTH